MDLASFIENQLNCAREERGISIAKLARRANMTPAMLSKTFRGIRDLKADELVMLCLVLELPFSRLVPVELMKRLEANKKVLWECADQVQLPGKM